MRRITIWLLTLFFMTMGIYWINYAQPFQIPDDKILIDSGISNWVPNPLIGSHNWKKFFSDEKYSASKKIETTWFYDQKTVIKATAEKINFKGQPMELGGATLVWTKVVGLKPGENKYLYYGVWPEKRVYLFFGIFEKEDGTKYVEEVGEMEDIEKMAPGMTRQILENLFNAIFKPWWKVW